MELSEYPNYDDTSYDENGHQNQAYLTDQGSPPKPGAPPYPSVHVGPDYTYPSAAPPYTGYNQSFPTLQLQPTKVVIQQQPSTRPNDFLILAIVTTVLFNPLIGGLAIWYSIKSRNASSTGDYLLAAKRGRDTLWISIGGILCSLVIVFSILILIFTDGLGVRSQSDQQFNNDLQNYN